MVKWIRDLEYFRTMNIFGLDIDFMLHMLMPIIIGIDDLSVQA